MHTHLLGGREEELWGPLLIHAKLAGTEVEKRALAVELCFSRLKAEMAVTEDQDLALTEELLEALEELRGSRHGSPGPVTFRPSELVASLAEKDNWGKSYGLVSRRRKEPPDRIGVRFITLTAEDREVTQGYISAAVKE
jgi:hypothetical protein